MNPRPYRVAIIGAGPSGTTLAALLARKGVSTLIFDDGKRPELVVGESLIPLMVTIFRRLGIEEKVKAFGIHKPGVTFTIDAHVQFELSFKAVEGVLPTYAYNVPRREFDQMLLDTALENGARYVQTTARLEPVPAEEPERVGVKLGAETLALAPEWGGEQPDLIVDASGRRRLLAKLLGLTADLGPRTDVAHFAHFEGCNRPQPEGQAITSRLAHGWSWRIPLNDNRLSVGVVINKEYAKEYGSTPEEVLEGVIQRDPRLSADCAHRRRVSPVASYANYQLTSHRGHGPGWVTVGDAFGFVDPMLSPGLAMAMLSAEKLADTIPATAPADAALLDRGLVEYLQWFRHFLAAWQDLVDLFYDGRIFALYKTGIEWRDKYPGKFSQMMERHVSKNIAGMAAGGFTTRGYSRGLLRFMVKYGMRAKPQDFCIR